jgi:hypothetical protein
VHIVIILTVIEVVESEVMVETHSMVIEEEDEIDDAQDEVEVMVETQYVDADEMVETLEIHTHIGIMIEPEIEVMDT